MEHTLRQPPNRIKTRTFIARIRALATVLRNSTGNVNRVSYQALAKILGARLPAIWHAYDRFVTAALISDGKRITCVKGCAACCCHHVDSVEPMELLAIHFRIRDREDYPILLEGFHRRTMQFQKLREEEGEKGGGEEADDRALFRYFRRGSPCPFLEPGGVCGIYKFRPMSCRMFFAESPPRFCAGAAIASPWNKNFQVELPEEAERALAECSKLLRGLKLPEGLFAGLLAVNALFGKYDGKV